MTVKRTSKNAGGSTWSPKVARHHCAGALRYALDASGASEVAAARWVGKSERSVRYWLSEKRAVDVDAVLRSGRLRRPFLRYLSVCDRKAGG